LPISNLECPLFQEGKQLHGQAKRKITKEKETETDRSWFKSSHSGNLNWLRRWEAEGRGGRLALKNKQEWGGCRGKTARVERQRTEKQGEEGGRRKERQRKRGIRERQEAGTEYKGLVAIGSRL